MKDVKETRRKAAKDNRKAPLTIHRIYQLDPERAAEALARLLSRHAGATAGSDRTPPTGPTVVAEEGNECLG